ncbi:hypothetical protein TL16_g05112, partial [Triparma laevis f. inornata]
MATPSKPRQEMSFNRKKQATSPSSTILLMSALTSDSADTASSHLNNMTNACAQDDDYRRETMETLEKNINDTEAFVSGWEGKVCGDFVALVIAVSGPKVSASEIIDVIDVNGKGERGGEQQSVALLLANVALNNKLHEKIRGQSVSLMAELGIPGTYLMQNEIALGKDSNETNIKGLNALYAKHLNELISCTIEYCLPMMVGKTATDLIKRLGGGAEEKALGMDMMENLMLLIQRMCRFATENYARLRVSLSKEAPAFVEQGILPFYKIVMKNRKDKAFMRRMQLCVQTLAILTFKTKAVRAAVAERHEKYLDKILEAVEGDLSSKPELFAAIVKLHMNIEGGHGSGWQDCNNRVLGKLAEAMLPYKKGGAKAVVFARCFELNNDGVPLNRASRAYGGQGSVGRGFHELSRKLARDELVELKEESGAGEGDKKKKKRKNRKKKKKGGGGGGERKEEEEEEDSGEEVGEEEGEDKEERKEEPSVQEKKDDGVGVDRLAAKVKECDVGGSKKKTETFADQWEARRE